MAIDPIRTGARIIPFPTRDAAARRTGEITRSADRPPVDGAISADPRRALVLARIQGDYYSQAHVRERVLDSLLEFLDEG